MISKLGSSNVDMGNYWALIIQNSILYIALYNEILAAMHVLPKSFNDNDICIIEYNNNIIFESKLHINNDKTIFFARCIFTFDRR